MTDVAFGHENGVTLADLAEAAALIITTQHPQRPFAEDEEYTADRDARVKVGMA